MAARGEGSETLREHERARREDSSASGGPPAPEFELRPLGVGALVDRALEFVRERPAACLGSAILFWLPAQYLSIYHGGVPSQDPELQAAQALLGLLAAYVVTVLTTAVIAVNAFGALLGRPLSAGAATARVLRRLPFVLASNGLTLLVIVPGLLACILPGLYFVWRLLFAQIIVVLEAPGPLRALRRSWQLTRSGASRWVGATLLTSFLTAPMSLAVTALESAKGAAWLRELHPAITAEVAKLITWIASSVLLGLPGALTAAMLVVLYLDQCVRLEGRDLHVRLSRLAAAGARSPAPAGPGERAQPGVGGLA